MVVARETDGGRAIETMAGEWSNQVGTGEIMTGCWADDANGQWTAGRVAKRAERA